MSDSKQAVRPARQHPATLEGAVLRALSEAASGQLRPLSAPKHVASKKASSKKPKYALKGSRHTDELVSTAQELREQFRHLDQLQVETVRVRPQGKDRQLRIEYAVDPADQRVILMRVSVTSSVPLTLLPNMLTTQQAADALNVSRPYITRLVDNGKVHGVERTQSGHRRIPEDEVMRLQAEMRSTRRSALESIDAATEDLRQRELSEAKAKAKRRWVAKPT